MAIVGYLYLTKEEDSVKKSVEVWKVKDLPPKKDEVIVKIKDKNGSTVNQKPTVTVYGFSIATIGEPITIYSRAEDKDGKIVSYLWQEKDKILGSKPELSVVLSEGEHTLKLRVKDNMGAMAKGSITIDVFAQYDKKIYYEHRGCHCKGLTYYYYNDEGNVTKEIHESNNGIEIKKYFYSDGKLQSMNYKQYYEKSNLQKESITRYDEFGNKIEVSGREKDGFTEENSDFETFLVRYKWDKKGRKLEESNQRDGKVQSVVKFAYYDDGNVDIIRESYNNGQLEMRNFQLYNYSDDGKLLHEILKKYDAKSETTKISYDRALTYNENGKIEREEIKRDGNIENSKEYRYSEGKLSQEVAYNSDGTIDSSTKYNYNANGLLIKQETIGVDGERINLKFYTYNSEGKETSSRLDYDGDGSFDMASKRFYDSEGNLIKADFYKDEVLDGFTRYNSSGKKVENSSSNSYRRFFYDEETGVLSKFILENTSGRKVIRFYDKDGEIIQEIDENGKEYYRVDER